MYFLRKWIALVALCFASITAAAQGTSPDCVRNFSFTAVGNSTTFDNRSNFCSSWVVAYVSTGFTGTLALTVQHAPATTAGVAGTWATFGGTVVSGSNPNTSVAQGQTKLEGYYPFMRVNLASLTGTGTVTGRLYGYRYVATKVNPGSAGGGLTEVNTTNIAPGSAQGDGVKFQLAAGTPVAGYCTEYDAGGNIVPSAGPCGSGGGASAVYTTTTFGATPTFTVSTSSLQGFLITLTGNVTSSTLSTASATTGQDIWFSVCQDGTGGRTFVPPTNVLGMGTISATVSTCSRQLFRWDGSNANAVSAMLHGTALDLTTGINLPTRSIAQGGTGQTAKAAAYDALSPNTTRGDLAMRGASNNERLPKGTQYQSLLGGATDLGWGAVDLSQASAVTGLLGRANGGNGVVALFATNAQTSTYQALAADFLACKTVVVASGTFTITLVASGAQPTTGQCLKILNYGTGVVTLARSGQNINGAAANLTGVAGSSTAPTGWFVYSDGSHYIAEVIVGSGSGTGVQNIIAGVGTSPSNCDSGDSNCIINNVAPLISAIDSGGDDNYSPTSCPGMPAAYSDGLMFSLVVSTANTGAATLDCAPGGAPSSKAIKLADGTTDPTTDDVVVGAYNLLVYRTAADGGAGAFIVKPSSSAGGTGTVNSGTSGNLSKYGASGTAVSEHSTAAGVLTLITTPSSANLAAALTDELGTGPAIFETKLNRSCNSTATGSDAYVCAMAVPLTTYTNACIVLTTDFSNIGAATVDVDGLGVKNLVRAGVLGLNDGDIPSGSPTEFCYDGTRFIQQGQVPRSEGRNGFSCLENFMSAILAAGTSGLCTMFSSTTGGTAAAMVAAEIDAPGINSIGTSTSATAVSTIAGEFLSTLFGGGVWTYTARVRIPTLSTGAERFHAQTGWFDTSSATPVDGCYFRYKDDVNSGNWEGICRSNSTETAIDTGVAPTANTWQIMSIQVNAAATSVSFWVGGVAASGGAITTNIQTGAGRQTGMRPLQMTKTVGTTARTFEIDWASVKFVQTTPN